MAFPEYIFIRYVATFRDQASRQMQQTDRAIRASALANQNAFSRMASSSIRSLNHVGYVASETGRSMGRTLSLPILATGAASVKMAADFEASMAKVQGLTGTPQHLFKSWRRDLLDTAVQFGRSTNEMADSLYYVGSAGLANNQVMATVKKSAEIAATGMSDASTAGSLLTSVLNAYRESGITAAHAADVFAATVKAGKAEPQELAESMGRVIPVSSQLKVSFDEVGASLAAMSNIGLDASEGVTATRQIMVQLLKPSAGATEQLKKLGYTAAGLREEIANKGFLPTLEELRAKMGGVGVSSAKLREVIGERGLAYGLKYLSQHMRTTNDSVAKVFTNIRALNGFLILTGENSRGVAKTFAQVEHSTGTLNKAFELTRKTTAFQFRVALVSLQEAAIRVGNILLPYFTKIAQAVSRLAQGFQTLSPRMKTAIVYFAGIAAAVGPLLIVFGSLARGVALLAALTLSPWAIAIVGALAVVGIALKSIKLDELNKNWRDMKPKLAEIWTELQHVVQTVVKKIGDASKWVAGQVKKNWDTISAAAMAVKQALTVVMDVAQGIIDFFRGDWDGALHSAADALTNFRLSVENVFKGILGAGTAMVKGMLTNWQTFAASMAVAAVAARRYGPLIWGMGGGVVPMGGGVARAGVKGIGIREAFQLGAGNFMSTTGLLGTRGGALGSASRGAFKVGGAVSRFGGYLGAVKNAFQAPITGPQITRLPTVLSKSGTSLAGTVAMSAAMNPIMSGLTRITAASRVALAPLLGTPFGLAAVAAVSGVAIYGLVKWLDRGRSSAEKLADAMKNVQRNTQGIMRGATALPVSSAQVAADRANLVQLNSDLDNQRKILKNLKPGSDAYKQVNAQIKNEVLQRAQAERQLNLDIGHLNQTLDKNIDRTRRLSVQTQTIHGTAQFADLNPAQQVMVRQLQAHQTPTRPIASGAVGASLTSAFDSNLKMAKAFVDSRAAVAKLSDQLPRLVNAFRAAAQNGVDPTSRRMVKLRENILKLQARLNDLGPAARHLGSVIKRPFSDMEIATLKSLGKVGSGLTEISRLLHRVPNKVELQYLTNLPTQTIPAVKEFMKLHHQIPSTTLVKMFFEHREASVALAAISTAIKKVPNDVVVRWVSNLPKEMLPAVTAFVEKTHKMPNMKRFQLLSNLRKDAIPTLTEFIRKTGKIPTKHTILIKFKEDRKEARQFRRQSEQDQHLGRLGSSEAGRMINPVLDRARETAAKAARSAQREMAKHTVGINFKPPKNFRAVAQQWGIDVKKYTLDGVGGLNDALNNRYGDALDKVQTMGKNRVPEVENPWKTLNQKLGHDWDTLNKNAGTKWGKIFRTVNGYTGRLVDSYNTVSGQISGANGPINVNKGRHGNTPNMAEGGIYRPVPGGMYRFVEAGHPEAIVSLDPKHKRRSMDIMGEAVKHLGARAEDILPDKSIPGFAKGGIIGRAYAEAQRISQMHLKYLYGGGHSTPAPANGPFDCSSFVSRVLQTAGLKIPTMTSGQFMNWGSPGKGALEVVANKGHVYMGIGGNFFGTSSMHPGGGPGPVPYHERPGFVVRHDDGAGGAIGGYSMMTPKQVKALFKKIAPGLNVTNKLARIIERQLRKQAGKKLTDLASMPLFAGMSGGSSGQNQTLGRRMMMAMGWGAGQWPSLRALWDQESGWSTTALNPSSGAYGIPQSLPANKMASAGRDWRNNAATQIQWGLNYIKGRYGSPAGAWNHEQRFNWYGKGTPSARSGWAVVGEHGPEMVRMIGGERVVPFATGGIPAPPPPHGIPPPPHQHGIPPPPPPGTIMGVGGQQHVLQVATRSLWAQAMGTLAAIIRGGKTTGSLRDIENKMSTAMLHRLSANISDRIAHLRRGGVTGDEAKIIKKLRERASHIQLEIVNRLHWPRMSGIMRGIDTGAEMRIVPNFQRAIRKDLRQIHKLMSNKISKDAKKQVNDLQDQIKETQIKIQEAHRGRFTALERFRVKGYKADIVKWQKQIDDLMHNHISKAEAKQIAKLKADIQKLRAGEAFREAMQKLIRRVHHMTFSSIAGLEKHIRNQIDRLSRGHVTPEERRRIQRLRQALRNVEKVADARLQKLIDQADHAYNLLSLREQGLELRQQIKGTFDTPGGAKARSDFITSRIIPALNKQIDILEKQRKQARAEGNKALAQQIGEAIAQKQNDVLQAQLDAQQAIKDATQATAEQLKNAQGQLSFQFNSQSFTDLITAGVGS